MLNCLKDVLQPQFEVWTYGEVVRVPNQHQQKMYSIPMTRRWWVERVELNMLWIYWCLYKWNCNSLNMFVNFLFSKFYDLKFYKLFFCTVRNNLIWYENRKFLKDWNMSVVEPLLRKWNLILFIKKTSIRQFVKLYLGILILKIVKTIVNVNLRKSRLSRNAKYKYRNS